MSTYSAVVDNGMMLSYMTSPGISPPSFIVDSQVSFNNEMFIQNPCQLSITSQFVDVQHDMNAMQATSLTFDALSASAEQCPNGEPVADVATILSNNYFTQLRVELEYYYSLSDPLALQVTDFGALL